MMKTRKLVVITSLVLVSLLITTGVVFALGIGAVNQGTDSAAEGDFSTVSGGRDNNIPDGSDFATIGGGSGNSTSTSGDTVGGGINNRAGGGGSVTVGGGEGNSAFGFGATVSGGQDNAAGGEASSTVGGGFGNRAGFGEVFAATVSGGEGNTATRSYTTVGGGNTNTASGGVSTVGGGTLNTASGHFSTIPGGESNIADGDYSFAAGRQAQANHTGTFVWADAITTMPPFPDEDFASTGENQFLIRASGGVGIGTNNPNQLMVVGDDLGGTLPGNRITIGNTGIPGPDGRSGLNLGEGLNQRAFILWQNDGDYLQLGVRNGDIQEQNALVVKDRRVGVGTATPTQRLDVDGNVRANQFLTSSSERWKTNIQTLEGALEKIEDLRGVSYDWKTDGKHDIGLIAEEVGKVIPEVVVYEENGKDAAAVDYARLAPVLIEAIKEQKQLLEDRDAQITSLEARISALEESEGIEGKGAQAGLLPLSPSVMWILAGGLGLVLATPGLILGYSRFRRDE